MSEEINGTLYNESDADIKTRGRKRRTFTFFAVAFATILVPAILARGFIGILPFDFPGFSALAWIIGLGIGGLAFAHIGPRGIVRVPQAQVFVTTNPWLALFNIKGNPNVIYGPGDSFAFFWEMRGEKSNLSLEIITISFDFKVPGMESQLLVAGSYQFKVDIRTADRFVGVDESTIRGGAIDRIEAKISGELAKKTVDEAKVGILDLNEELGEHFGVGPDKKPKDPQVSTAVTPSIEKDTKIDEMERQYGISSVAVTIKSIDLPPDVQKTRDAQDEANQAIKGVASMYGMTVEELKADLKSGKISIETYNDMLDRFAAKSGNATMDIRAVKISGAKGSDASSVLFGAAGGPNNG